MTETRTKRKQYPAEPHVPRVVLPNGGGHGDGRYGTGARKKDNRHVFLVILLEMTHQSPLFVKDKVGGSLAGK